MEKDEFLKKAVDLSSVLNVQEIEYGLKLFREDAEGDCELADKFPSFRTNVDRSYKITYQHTLHYIMREYIYSLENAVNVPYEVLGVMYLSDAEYYVYNNVYSEAMRNIFCALDMDSLSGHAVSNALSMLITMLFDNKMIGPANRYVEKIETLIKKGKLPYVVEFAARCGIVTARALSGDWYRLDEEIKKIETYDKDKLYPGVYEYFEAIKISAMAMKHANELPSPEFVEKARKVINNLNANALVCDSFAVVFLPVIDYIKYVISPEELIILTKKLIAVSNSLSDKIELYEVLMEEVKPTEKKHPEIIAEYNKALYAYYHSDKETRKEILESGIINHDLEKKYKKTATTDALTGLRNRMQYEEKIKSLSSIRGELPWDTCFVVMDVNRLKQTNDTYGHEAGDELLKGAAYCANMAFNDIGSVYRVGGDELIAIMNKEIPFVKSRLKELEMHCHEWKSSYGGTLSISYGYASMRDITESGMSNSDKIKQLVKMADNRMYEFKRTYYIENDIKPR